MGGGCFDLFLGLDCEETCSSFSSTEYYNFPRQDISINFLKCSDLLRFIRFQIDEVKAKIEAQQKHPKSWQKLIFAGKILADQATVQSYGIKENDFVVLIAKQVSLS
jgi:hypothetical protein